MARRCEDYPGNRRTRTTISVPQELMDLVPVGENFSAIVTQLLDENIDKIADVGIDEIKSIRTRNAKALVYEEIDSLKTNIAKSIGSNCANELDKTVEEMEQRIQETRELLDTMRSLKIYFIAQRRYMKVDLPKLLEVQIKKTINELTTQSNE